MLIFLANGLLTYYILPQIVTDNRGGIHACPVKKYTFLAYGLRTLAYLLQCFETPFFQS